MSSGPSPARRPAPTTEPADVPMTSPAPAGIPAELIGEGAEHADMERVADHPAGTEDHGNPRVAVERHALQSGGADRASSLAVQ